MQDVFYEHPVARTERLSGNVQNQSNKPKRAKRQREFLVEVRELPSGLGEMIGKKPTGWLLAFPFSKLELARRAIIKEGTRTPTFFTRGYEFRIRRTDRKL